MGERRCAAIEYVPMRREAFQRYLDDGRLEIDNNDCERALRCVATGRKNCLFFGSAFGGERAVRWFVLVASARLAKVEPWQWLVDVLTRLAELRDQASPPEQLEHELRSLLPRSGSRATLRRSSPSAADPRWEHNRERSGAHGTPG